MTRILLMFLFLSSPSFAANIHHSTKALSHLTKCLPSQNMACVVGSTGCTEAQFCTACTALSDADPSACFDKPFAFAGLEGLYGQIEGSCYAKCGKGASVQSVRVNAASFGNEDLTLVKNVGSNQGLASAAYPGGTILYEVSYDGTRKQPGDTLRPQLAAVAHPIAYESQCLKGNADANISGCFTATKNCGKLFSKKATRCTACTSISSCSDDFKSMFQAMFSVNLCGGC